MGNRSPLRRRQRLVRLRAVALTFLTTMLMVADLQEAEACSCAQMNPRTGLDDADAAFVGTVISIGRIPVGAGGLVNTGQAVPWVFEVEQVVKGDLSDTVVLMATTDGGSCGIGARVGDRVGLFAYDQGDGTLTSGLCSQVDPESLIAAGRPHPPPDGPEAIVVPTTTTTTPPEVISNGSEPVESAGDRRLPLALVGLGVALAAGVYLVRRRRG